MTEKQAQTIAHALGGEVVRPEPHWGVAVTRADGRYVLIESDAGAVYFDEHACWVGYATVGSDPKGSVEAEEWIEWGISEAWATGLATLIGGQPHQSGGNIWVVLYQRPDGRFALIGDLGAEIYDSRQHYEGYYHPGQEEPERVDWE